MLRLEHIQYGVPDHPNILNDISMQIEDGETIVITGPNGGGKTSLAKVIAGVKDLNDGHIYLDDQDITQRNITERARSGIAYAFQQPVRFKGFTARDILEMSSEQPITHDKACDLLSKVGLCTHDYIDRAVDDKLSGGEMKRIEIASILSRQARLYIFDEPEAGIDLWSFNNLIEVFKELKEDKDASILIISHQERIIDIADRIAVISEGRLEHFGPKEEVLPKLTEKPQTFHCLDRKGDETV